jgi:uncharacterized protein YacL
MDAIAQRHEIDHRTIKLIVGAIALFLANLTSFLSGNTIESISAAYYADEWARNVLVGCLFAIAAFLLAYNGYSRTEGRLSKVAAVAALGVAMFPCDCGRGNEIIPHLHGIAAAVMFVVLASFCYQFYRRAANKGHAEANRRAFIYAACGLIIAAVIVVLGADELTHGALKPYLGERLTFYGERAGLMAFGVSWLTASRVLPGLASPVERFVPFRAVNPED